MTFTVHPDDHEPPHVHARYAETKVILQIDDGAVRLSARHEAVQPTDARRSDVRKILETAARHVNALETLWEVMHP